MPELSEWLKVMLGEVNRKREEEVRAATEQRMRSADSPARPPEPNAVATTRGP